jgi:hypothetical protein
MIVLRYLTLVTNANAKCLLLDTSSRSSINNRRSHELFLHQQFDLAKNRHVLQAVLLYQEWFAHTTFSLLPVRIP